MNTQKDKLAAEYDEGRYPPDFLARCEILEGLSVKPECETVYVKDRQSGEFAVAKCYMDKSLLSREDEGHILSSLKHDGLPRFLGEFESETVLCVVREYVPGVTLAELLEEAPLSEPEAMTVMLQLCDILTYLHSQTPPVIHRDLKPQNIILTDGGKVKLIDFGISRMYDETAKKDTVFYGTQEFAPPEQYGFSQTDQRADLFSLGVVMGYILTGQTDLDAAAAAIKNKRLSRIYRKCTDFSPRGRYASAEELKSALLRSDGKRQRAAARTLTAALICVLFLCAGFAVGRYTDVLSPPPAGVQFTEPLIERAVRLQLGKNDGDVITEEELLSVTELYIFGSEVIAKTEQEMNDASHRLFEENRMKTGPIVSLADLTMLPNLQCVAVAMQQVSDLTPLASLPQLRVVIVKNNPIGDISPLSGLKQLEKLSLFGAVVSDFSQLSACPRLVDLDAGATLARTPAAFAGLDMLTNLNLYQLTFDTLDSIEQFRRLKFIEFGGVVDGDLTPLLALPELETALLGESLRDNAEEIIEQAHFTIEYE